MLNWNKKEKPILGYGGFGGGSGGLALGGSSGPGPLGASGGNIADALEPGNGYVYHTFSSPGNFTCVNTNEIEILVVGGGGATNQFCGGGGGGGGICHAVNYEVSAATHPVTVGPGGTASHPGPDDSAGQGGVSYFGASGPTRLTGYGGGRGAKAPEATFPFVPGSPTHNSQTGGSGAGGVRNGPWPGNQAPSDFYAGKATTQVNPLNQSAPGTITNYGNAGGAGGGGAPSSLTGGGGGGAGAAGSGSVGGHGQPFPQFEYTLCFPSPYRPGLTPYSPNNTHYAGGGGGGRHLAGQGANDGGSTSGGDGGGGRGGNGQPVRETDGVNYLGGGGGDGGGYEPKGSDGGSGIVIIRYPTAVK